jgi:hypothetical protein
VERGDDAFFDERDARFSDVTTDDDDVLGHGGKKPSRPSRVRPDLVEPRARRAVSAGRWVVCRDQNLRNASRAIFGRMRGAV